jgi:hypothetical protein
MKTLILKKRSGFPSGLKTNTNIFQSYISSIMKFSFVFFLFLLFISCNNTPQPAVVSGLEEPSQTELDSIKNASASKNTSNALALKNSKALLYINNGLKGVYLGTIDNKYFKLCIEKTYGDNAEGYVMIGTDKRIVKGKITKLGTEPTTTGNLTIYRAILDETTTMNGQYVITLSLSAKNNSGEGARISKNKKQQSPILIKERAL